MVTKNPHLDYASSLPPVWSSRVWCASMVRPRNHLIVIRQNRRNPVIGSLLLTEVEGERASGGDPVEERLQLRRRGPIGPRPPAALQESPGIQPGADPAQRLGPGGQR